MPLFVPVPAGLGEFIGYRGTARYIAVFWSDDADEVVVTDGLDRHTGESLRFLAYMGHRAVECELGDLNIGLFDRPSTVWLLLDRQSNNLYFAPLEVVRAFVENQHPSQGMRDRIELRRSIQAVLRADDGELESLLDQLDRFLRTDGQ